MLGLPFLFFIVALLYSLVGFGGGSSYIALLALFNVPYQSIPQVALVCNLIVVAGGAIHFIRKGYFSFPLFWPFILGSIPLAFLGGRIPVSKEVFYILLGLSLVIAGLRLFLFNKLTNYENVEKPNWKLGIAVGGILGLLSGMVGIGGGIFLAPILLNLRWGKPKQVAATASLFIFVNSISGLSGQIIKTGSLINISSYWPLFLAVLLGGQIGSSLGSGKVVSHSWIRSLTAALVLFVGIRLLLK